MVCGAGVSPVWCCLCGTMKDGRHRLAPGAVCAVHNSVPHSVRFVALGECATTWAAEPCASALQLSLSTQDITWWSLCFHVSLLGAALLMGVGLQCGIAVVAMPVFFSGQSWRSASFCRPAQLLLLVMEVNLWLVQRHCCC
jgi:hypothetical protein